MYFEQIRIRGFNFEAQNDKKLVYRTFGFIKSLTKEKKIAIVIVSNATHVTLGKVPGARFLCVKENL